MAKQDRRDYQLGVVAASRVSDSSLQATLEESQKYNRYLHYDWWRGVYDICRKRLTALDEVE